MPDYANMTESNYPPQVVYSAREELPDEGYGDVDNWPELDFQQAKVEIKNKYFEDTKQADLLLVAGQPPPPQWTTLHESAKREYEISLAKLQANYDKAERAFIQLAQNPNLSASEIYEGKMGFYEKNPVWTFKKPLTPEERLQKAETELAARTMAGVVEDVFRISPEESYARVWSETEESIRPTEYAGPTVRLTAPTKEVLPTTEQISEFKRLGGFETEEGRAYVKKLYPSVNIPPRRELETKLKMAGAPQPSPFGVFRPSYETPYEEPIEKRPTITQPATLPPKPIGYPDAIWNKHLKSWTIIRNGKLIKWQP